MKIAIIGYGAMGREIEKQARELGHFVTKVVDIDTEQQITTSKFDEDEVAIEFSTPKSVISNLKSLIEKKVSVVCGTTGWYEDKDYVQKLVKANGVGFLHATNFAIGTHIFWKGVAELARYINKFTDYDIFMNEIHHKNKLDSPSGTAITTAEILLDNIRRKRSLDTNKVDGRIRNDHIHLSSTRGGHVIGDHKVTFDGPHDSIEISHCGKSRASYAIGAIKSAEWVHRKKGFFSINNYIEDNIN